MKKIKFARVYNYDRSGQLKYDGTARIYIRAYLQGKNHFYPTGISVKPGHWDKKNRRIINHPNQVNLNREISEIEYQLEKIESQIIQKEGGITLEKLRHCYKQGSDDISFTEFFLQQLNVPNIARNSFTDQRQTYDKLLAYRKLIYFDDLNFRLIKGFDSFLHEMGLHTNTIAKHHKNLKKYINLAIKFDYLDVNRNPYKRFAVKKEPTDRIFITEAELEKIALINIPKDKAQWEIIRDMFLFMCWTGLRFADAKKLKATNFSETSEGIELFHIASKTKKPHRLKLAKLFNGKPERLVKEYLDKYDLLYYDDPDHPIPFFFNNSNQHINREIKKIVKNLDIREKVKSEITCHVGRHTFGTIMAGKIPIHILQRLMQHSNIRETMIYVHLNQKMVDDALDEVQW